jgi:exodeoxyribonuclease VII small subunit
MNMTYEEALQELQQIIAQLQEDQVSIDELSQQSKRAAELIEHCRAKLRETEADIGGLFEG